jgi:hypothetical protein
MAHNKDQIGTGEAAAWPLARRPVRPCYGVSWIGLAGVMRAPRICRLGSHPNIYGMIEGYKLAKRLHKRALASSGKTPGDRIEGGSHLWHLGLTR